ncbi:hypothetical protein RJ640_029952, partial [Escallonia rubra]
ESFKLLREFKSIGRLYNRLNDTTKSPFPFQHPSRTVIQFINKWHQYTPIKIITDAFKCASFRITENRQSTVPLVTENLKCICSCCAKKELTGSFNKSHRLGKFKPKEQSIDIEKRGSNPIKFHGLGNLHNTHTQPQRRQVKLKGTIQKTTYSPKMAKMLQKFGLDCTSTHNPPPFETMMNEEQADALLTGRTLKQSRRGLGCRYSKSFVKKTVNMTSYVTECEDSSPALSEYEERGCSNDEAEYEAIIMGLELSLKVSIDDLTIYGDSELIIKQVKGEYQIRKPNILPYYERADYLLSKFPKLQIRPVRREVNSRADALASLADSLGL